MMNIQLFREIIDRRIYVEKISQGEWADGIEECWEREIAVLSEDIQGTINYLISECTADEFSWISEIIDDLAIKTQNRALINAYKSLMTKFPKECEMYHIADCIQYAEAVFDQA